MNKLDKKSVTGISALLVHAANIDEIYSDHEKDLVKDFIKSYLNDDTDEILKEAEMIESNSNQLLSYTNIIKENSLEIKKDIIEHLWKVIISDNTVDQYESNLMRRICGLIYFPDKECAEIKLKLLNYKRIDPSHKNLKYKKILSYLKKLDNTEYDIALHKNKKFLETGTSNLLFIKNNRVYSPKNNFYSGITFKFFCKKIKIN